MKYLKYVIALLIPSVIIGFLILPLVCKIPVYKPPYKPVRVVKSIYAIVKEFPGGVYVNITPPSNVTKSTGLLYLKAVYPETATLKVIIYSVYPPLVPNSNYDPYSSFYIAFVNVKTNKTVEPSGVIYFEVSKNWLTNREHRPTDVIALRYHGKWSKLNTELIGSKKEFYVYRAEVPAFSYFTIAALTTISPNCTKCHHEVAVELEFSPYHDFSCLFCHHGMSSNVTCVSCHPNIGNFSAHKKLVEWAIENPLMKGSNEACIACHTYAEVPICNITVHPYMSFEYSWSTKHVLFKKVPSEEYRIKYWKKYTYQSLNLTGKPPSRSPWW